MNSNEIIKSGVMVKIPNSRAGMRPQQQEIDIETATEIREVKTGKLTGGMQAERLKTYAEMQNKQLVLAYNPKHHPEITQNIKNLRDNYGFELRAEKSFELPETYYNK